MFINAQDSAFSYTGRLDEAKNDAFTFYYAGTMAIINCSGTKFSVRVRNHHMHSSNAIGFVIDGKVGKVDLPYDDGIYDLLLCENLEDKMHEIIIYKTHCAHNYFDFFGIICDNDARYEKCKLPKMKIECYGDSVSAGEVCEAVDFCEKHDPEGHNGTCDNAWYSFTMQLSRLLNAQIHNIAQGGIALRDKTGYYDSGKLGLETVYDKTCYFPHIGFTQWNFSKYIPDVVVIAIGQNDPHNEFGEDFDITDPSYRRIWKDAYIKFLRTLRGHYKNASFVLCTTVLMHSDEWDMAIDEAREEFGDSKVYKYTFKRNGSATPGHPRIPEQAEMATELCTFIQSSGMCGCER